MKQEIETNQTLLVTASELAKLLGVSVRQIWRMNSAGKIPKPIRMGNCVRWMIKEIEAWLEAGVPDRVSWESIRK